MISSCSKLLLLISLTICSFSCTVSDTENDFDKKPISSIDSKNGNIVFHFTDHSSRSFSPHEVETFLSEKKIAKNTYLLCLQKMKEEALRIQQRKTAADKAGMEKYPYRINGRDVYYVESKKGRFTIHLADKTSQSFSLHEIDCMMINHIITEELYLKCIQKQSEDEALYKKDSSILSFSFREINCPEFN